MNVAFITQRTDNLDLFLSRDIVPVLQLSTKPCDLNTRHQNSHTGSNFCMKAGIPNLVFLKHALASCLCWFVGEHKPYRWSRYKGGSHDPIRAFRDEHQLKTKPQWKPWTYSEISKQANEKLTLPLVIRKHGTAGGQVPHPTVVANFYFSSLKHISWCLMTGKDEICIRKQFTFSLPTKQSQSSFQRGTLIILEIMNWGR